MRLLALALCLLAGGFTGCTMCQHPYDQHYGMYGGTWERFNPTQGRVGSRFNNAGGPTTIREEIQTPAEPSPSDAPYRPEVPSRLQPDMEEAKASPLNRPTASASLPSSRRRTSARVSE